MLRKILNKSFSAYGKTIFLVIAIKNFGLLFEGLNIFYFSLMIIFIIISFVGAFSVFEKHKKRET